MNAGKNTLALCIVTALLAACGSKSSSDSTGPDRSLIPTVNIADFSVNKGAATENGITTISPTIDEGKFTLDWNVTSANTFQLRLFLSADEILSTDDIRLFSNAMCGAVRLNDCMAQDQYDCQFSSDNTLACTDGWQTYSGDLVTKGFLKELPQQAYFIAQTCIVNECKTAVTKVEFQ